MTTRPGSLFAALLFAASLCHARAGALLNGVTDGGRKLQ